MEKSLQQNLQPDGDTIESPKIASQPCFTPEADNSLEN
jgi:hypothetical protein